MSHMLPACLERFAGNGPTLLIFQNGMSFCLIVQLSLMPISVCLKKKFDLLLCYVFAIAFYYYYQRLLSSSSSL